SVIDYTPDTGYSGPDTMQYEVFVDGVSQGVRNVCLTVVYQEGPKAWRPIDPFCVLENGARNGYQGWNTLEEYDTYHGDATGITKPNVPGDPDYVAPVYNLSACSIQSLLTVNNTDTDTEDIYRLFVDTDVEIWVNSSLVHTQRGTGTYTMSLSVGDSVEVRQISDTE